jgi:hypothetical protein
LSSTLTWRMACVGTLLMCHHSFHTGASVSALTVDLVG